MSDKVEEMISAWAAWAVRLLIGGMVWMANDIRTNVQRSADSQHNMELDLASIKEKVGEGARETARLGTIAERTQAEVVDLRVRVNALEQRVH